MSDKLQNFFALTGRLLLAALFLPAGLLKLTDFAAAVSYASAALPAPELGAVAAIVVEIAAGLALLIGYRTRTAALLLAIFSIVASLLFHNYWAQPAPQQTIQQLLFFKNVAIVGGLLTLAAWGAGAWSFDARRRYAVP